MWYRIIQETVTNHYIDVDADSEDAARQAAFSKPLEEWVEALDRTKVDVVGGY